jgi:hypothetical protein
MQIKATSGTGSAAAGIIGTGLAMALPDQRWIGFVLMAVGCIIFVFDIKVEGGRIRFGNPKGRQVNSWGPWILIVGGPLIGVLWLYFMPHSISNQPRAPEQSSHGSEDTRAETAKNSAITPVPILDAQLQEIRALRDFLGGKDETGLRETFGIPDILKYNIMFVRKDIAPNSLTDNQKKEMEQFFLGGHGIVSRIYANMTITNNKVLAIDQH